MIVSHKWSEGIVNAQSLSFLHLHTLTSFQIDHQIGFRGIYSGI